MGKGCRATPRVLPESPLRTARKLLGLHRILFPCCSQEAAQEQIPPWAVHSSELVAASQCCTISMSAALCELFSAEESRCWMESFIDFIFMAELR